CADQDTPHHRFVFGRILPDAQEARRTVEPAAMEERSPFDAKGAEGIDRGIRRLIAERLEGLTIVTWVKRQRHGRLSYAAASVARALPVGRQAPVVPGAQDTSPSPPARMRARIPYGPSLAPAAIIALDFTLAEQ